MSLDLSFTCPTCGPVGRSVNITHNLLPMATACGLRTLWYPEEATPGMPPGQGRAADLLPMWEAGLVELAEHRDRYRAMNPTSRWGDYDALLDAVVLAVEALRECPHGATVNAWR